MKKTGKWIAVTGIALAAFLGLGALYAQLSPARPMTYEDKCPMQKNDDKSGTFGMSSCNMASGRAARVEPGESRQDNPAAQPGESLSNELARKQSGQDPGKLGSCGGGMNMTNQRSGSHVQSSPMEREPDESREKGNSEGSSCH